MRRIMAIIALVIITVTSLVGCGDNNPVGTSSVGNLLVFKSENLTDGTAYNPNSTVGTSNVWGGSFVVISEGGSVSQIVLQDNPNSPMGRNFQNLVLRDGYTGLSLGTTKGDLNTSPGKYVFNLDPATILVPFGWALFNTFVDTKNNAQTGKNIPGLIVYSITIDGVEYRTSVNLQSLYISLYINNGKG